MKEYKHIQKIKCTKRNMEPLGKGFRLNRICYLENNYTKTSIVKPKEKHGTSRISITIVPFTHNKAWSWQTRSHNKAHTSKNKIRVEDVVILTTTTQVKTFVLVIYVTKRKYFKHQNKQLRTKSCMIHEIVLDFEKVKVYGQLLFQWSDMLSLWRST